ncbi:hypothetical protein XCM_21555 [Xanthomonas citri pv. mangiferaeindicae]|nr:hypothetical protein XCM_21555 [Xanthomonas citri pv. mangiferaeindicae]
MARYWLHQASMHRLDVRTDCAGSACFDLRIRDRPSVTATLSISSSAGQKGTYGNVAALQ